MAYTPTTWAAGDTLTAAGLNKMEQGIASAASGGSLIVDVTTFESGDYTMLAGKTAGEIWDALKSGRPIVARFFDSSADPATDEPLGFAAQVYVSYNAEASPAYSFEFGQHFLGADSLNDYPYCEPETVL